MSGWISVEDSLPDVEVMTLFIVATRVGSMSPKNIVNTMRFKPYAAGGRFMAGDWVTVTHWQPLPSLPENIK